VTCPAGGRGLFLALARFPCLGTIALLLFAPASIAQEKVPRAVLGDALYDFGTVKQGTTLSHTISLRNAGEAPLVIETIASSLPTLSIRAKRIIAPAEEATITLELDTGGLSGEVRDDVIVHTNDPKAPRLSFRIQGQVHSAFQILPRPMIALSAFRWEAETKAGGVTIVNQEESPLEILGKRVEGNHFTVDLTPIEQGRRYQLAVRLLPTAPAGHANGRITLSTSKGEIQIPVFTFLKDRVYVNPPDADLGRIDLDQVQREPRMLAFRAQSVFIYKYEGRDFRIRAESPFSFVGIEQTPADGPGAVIDIPRQGPTGVFELKLAPIKEQLKPGTFHGTIHVSTNDEQFPEVLIPVRLEVK
jgi:hypothetical protein